MGEHMNKASAPKWPFIFGPLISITGIVMGFTVPVGFKCSGAFDSNHLEAAGYDIAYATVNGVQSHVADACRAAAPAQMGIYWGIIGFGIAIVILGVVLRSAANRTPAIAGFGPTVSTAKELTSLAALRDQGILTMEEFETQKQRLLRD